MRVCVLALSTACWCWCLSAAEKGSKKDGREGEVQWEEIEEKSNSRVGGRKQALGKGEESCPVSPESPSTAEGQ